MRTTGPWPPDRGTQAIIAGVTDASRPFSEEDADPDPFRQFERWFQDAAGAGTSQPEAAALATATPQGSPSVRMVLVKRTGPGGFVFYTNYESRKGGELTANPRAALLFHWQRLGRQVRIEGPVERTTREDSLAYAHSRPRGSQLSAAASPQSRPVPGREWLERRVAELDAQHAGAEVPLSDSWGGFRLAPERFEFWQHRDSRLHDRLVYTPEPAGTWKVERLAP
jgi:pyridoxamine 5'-phosphate oxidase